MKTSVSITVVSIMGSALTLDRQNQQYWFLLLVHASIMSQGLLGIKHPLLIAYLSHMLLHVVILFSHVTDQRTTKCHKNVNERTPSCRRLYYAFNHRV